MGRLNTEWREVFRGRPLNAASTNFFSENIPVGEGILRARVCINIAITQTTAADPKTDGELEVIKAMNFRTDRNEFLYKNVAGRGLYFLNQLKKRIPPQRDVIAAANGTYRVYLDLDFVDDNVRRPYDTILNSHRNKSLELSITMGALSDLFDTVGDAAMVLTMDMMFERVKGKLPDAARPLFIQEVGNIQPQNPASQLYFDLERADSLAYKSIIVGTHNDVISGTPFSGTGANDVLAELEIETDIDYPIKATLARVIQANNAHDYEQSVMPDGIYMLDFVRPERSNKAALHSALFSRLRVQWINDTLSSSQISGIYTGLRDLK